MIGAFRSVAAAVAACCVVAGCQTTQPSPNVFARTDGKSIRGNPQLLAQAEQDKTICIGETQKSAVGQAPVYYQGLGGAIAAGIIVDQRNSALVDIFKGCMATKGYVLVPRAVAEQRETDAAAKPSKKRS